MVETPAAPDWTLPDDGDERAELAALGIRFDGTTPEVNLSQTSDETETVGFQWQSSTNGTTFTNISGATGSTYTLGEGDENRFVRVHASLTDDTGQTVSADSTATTAVKDVAPTLSVSVSGNAVEGSVLTASPSQTRVISREHGSSSTTAPNSSGAPATRTTPYSRLAFSGGCTRNSVTKTMPGPCTRRTSIEHERSPISRSKRKR